MKIELLIRGKRHDIGFVSEGTGSGMTFRGLADELNAHGSLAAKRLRSKRKPKDKPPEWKKLLALLKRTCDHGLSIVSRNPQKCKFFKGHGNKLGEFKSNNIRAIFFVDEESNRIIITHCFKKQTYETRQAEIERAHRLRTTYFKAKDQKG